MERYLLSKVIRQWILPPLFSPTSPTNAIVGLHETSAEKSSRASLIDRVLYGFDAAAAAADVALLLALWIQASSQSPSVL